MIDEKKIEEAAAYYAEENTRLVEDQWGDMITDTEELSEAYKEGAHWAINEFLRDLWHPNTEEPDKSKSDIITLDFDNDAYLQFKESILWSEESWRHSISRCQITKWAYVSDLFPKEGGEK